MGIVPYRVTTRPANAAQTFVGDDGNRPASDEAILWTRKVLVPRMHILGAVSMKMAGGMHPVVQRAVRAREGGEGQLEL